MNIYKQLQCSCIICKNVYSVKGIHTHFERAHGTDEQKSKYSSGYNGHYESEEFKNKLRKDRQTVSNICECCRESFTYVKIVDHPIRKTCSKSCSSTLGNERRIANGYAYTWTDEMKEEASERSKELWKDPEYVELVTSSSSYKRRFTSKNEVLIRDYFINNFPEDEWTFGGSLKVSDENIVRDLYSNKLKICFEYDGIWHFKDIHGQLHKKQKKDKLLEEWCIDNGYSLVRLDEDKFNKGSIVALTELFHSIESPSIVKIGDRYC